MNMRNLKFSIMNFFNFLFNLVYLNLLWLLFSLVGLVIAGVGPATVALFKALEVLRVDKTAMSFKEYWHEYKKAFGKSNKVFFLFFALLLATLVNFRIALVFFKGNLFLQSLYLTLFVLFLSGAFLALANLSKLDLSLGENIKFTMVEMFRFPLKTLSICLTVFIVGLVLWAKFFFLLVFGIALCLYIVNVIHSDLLGKIVNLKKKYEVRE